MGRRRVAGFSRQGRAAGSFSHSMLGRRHTRKPPMLPRASDPVRLADSAGTAVRPNPVTIASSRWSKGGPATLPGRLACWSACLVDTNAGDDAAGGETGPRPEHQQRRRDRRFRFRSGQQRESQTGDEAAIRPSRCGSGEGPRRADQGQLLCPPAFVRAYI